MAYWRDEGEGMIAVGESVSYEQKYPGATYISGSMHHVKLSGLEPSTTYYYR